MLKQARQLVSEGKTIVAKHWDEPQQSKWDHAALRFREMHANTAAAQSGLNAFEEAGVINDPNVEEIVDWDEASANSHLSDATWDNDLLESITNGT